MMGSSGGDEEDAEDTEADGWDDVADAPIAVHPVDAVRRGADEDDVIVQGDLGEFQQPRRLPEPIAPSRETHAT